MQNVEMVRGDKRLQITVRWDPSMFAVVTQILYYGYDLFGNQVLLNSRVLTDKKKLAICGTEERLRRVLDKYISIYKQRGWILAQDEKVSFGIEFEVVVRIQGVEFLLIPHHLLMFI